MDALGETLRVVTHSWGGGGISDLFVLDFADPVRPRVIGKLRIDDAGNLWATRFAGDRLYTIHVPRGVDPLDVIDLSDPRNPVLKDVLEIPGAVTHIEVMGTKLVTIGIAELNGPTQVAASLFDVTDPSNAILLDREVFEGAWSGSAALWEPKALTVVAEESLLVVPFESHNQGDWYAGTVGVQLVGYDLEKGDITLLGSTEGTDPVCRTKYHRGRILATGDTALQVIDAHDAARPRVTAKLELAADVRDSQDIAGTGFALQLVQVGWWSSLELRVVQQDDRGVSQPVALLRVPMDYGAMVLEDRTAVLVGGSWRGTATASLVTVDVSDPVRPALRGMVSLPEGTSIEAWTDFSESVGGIAGMLALRPGVLVAGIQRPYGVQEVSYDQGVAYDDYYVPPDREYAVFDVRRPSAPTVAFFTLPDQWPNHMVAGSDGKTVLFTSSVPAGSVERDGANWPLLQDQLTIVDITHPSTPAVSAPLDVTGTVVADDLVRGIVYTVFADGETDGDAWYDARSILAASRVTADGSTIVWAVDIGDTITSVAQRQGLLYVVSVAGDGWYGSAYGYYGYGYGYGYYGGGYGPRVAEEDGSSDEPVPTTTVTIVDPNGGLAGKGPRVVGGYSVEGIMSLALVTDHALVLQSGGDGFLVLDISSPAAPAYGGLYPSPWYASGVRETAEGGLVLIGGWYGVAELAAP